MRGGSTNKKRAKKKPKKNRNKKVELQKSHSCTEKRARHGTAALQRQSKRLTNSRSGSRRRLKFQEMRVRYSCLGNEVRDL